MKKVEMKDESTEYDNFIGKKSSEYKATLDSFFEDDVDIYNKVWEKHWQGMPEFEQNKNKPFKTVYVHCRTEEDYNEFVKVMDQPMTIKTKSIWYPMREPSIIPLLRWVDEE
jgi:hypothetical protein